MKNLKQFFDFYLDSSLHVGLAVLAYSKIVSLHFHQNSNYNWLYFVFFATIVGYNFLKYYDVFKNRSSSFIQKYSAIFAVSLLAIFASIYLFFNLNIFLEINIVCCSFLVILYPFLRRFWYLKTLIVAFCVTVFIFAPFLYLSQIPTMSLGDETLLQEYIYMLKIFLFILASMMPFEIYDAQYDDKMLQTIPQKFGVKIAKSIGYFLISGFVILSFFEKKTFKIDLFIAALMILAVLFTNKKRSKYFCSFWVESIPIFWLLLLVFG